MYRNKLTCLWALTTLILIFSCGKSGSKPSPTTAPPGSVNINLGYSDPGAKFELIISEPAGKVLLDTMATGPAPVVATLRTNDSLLDVTSVVSGGNQYSIQTLRSINPSTLKWLDFGGYIMAYGLKAGNTTPASIYYKNIPPGILTTTLAPQFLFTNYPWNEFSGAGIDPYANSVSVTYNRYPGNYAYFLLPGAGLYSLHMQVNARDTIDCSHLDTAVALTFNRPEPFTVSALYSSFIGIPDTTDMTKVISFSDFFLAAPSRPGVDLEYPNIPVQKYELNVYATNASNDAVGYYCYTNEIPLTLPLVKESDFTISSSTDANFSVTFSGTKPSYYRTYWKSDSVYWDIISPDDAGSFDPTTLIANQKSRMLQGIDLSSMQIQEFEMENVDGMPYRTWLPYITDPSQISSHRISFAANLIKSFP